MPNDSEPNLLDRIKKPLLLAVGCVALALGIIGIFLPLLPTTPFLLLAAACFVRSSQRLYDRLLANRWLGSYIRNYRERRGIPLHTKLIALCLLWGTISYSALFVVDYLPVRLLLLAIALGVTIHLVSVRTYRG